MDKCGGKKNEHRPSSVPPESLSLSQSPPSLPLNSLPVFLLLNLIQFTRFNAVQLDLPTRLYQVQYYLNTEEEGLKSI